MLAGRLAVPGGLARRFGGGWGGSWRRLAGGGWLVETGWGWRGWLEGERGGGLAGDGLEGGWKGAVCLERGRFEGVGGRGKGGEGWGLAGEGVGGWLGVGCWLGGLAEGGGEGVCGAWRWGWVWLEGGLEGGLAGGG